MFETFVGSTINAKAKKIVFCFLLPLLFLLGYHSAIITINKSNTSKLSNDNIPYRRNLIRRMNNSLHLQYLPKVPTMAKLFQISNCLANFFSVCVSHRMLIATKVSPRLSKIWPRFCRCNTFQAALWLFSGIHCFDCFD